jgi:hypothetical protein
MNARAIILHLTVHWHGFDFLILVTVVIDDDDDNFDGDGCMMIEPGHVRFQGVTG